MAGKGEQIEQEPRGRVWRRILSAPEGKALVLGAGLFLLYMAAIALTGLWSGEVFRSLLTMTGVHVIGGRAAGMSWGYTHDLSGWTVIGANMAIEVFLVLLFYPLFVFSYQKLIVIAPLRESMERAQRAAETHRRTVMKYGIPGLLLFVWFPFWMTGPLVGCIIGFLIGLRPWVNLSVVLSGTCLAIVCWGLILGRIHRSLTPLGPYVPFAFVGLVLLLAVSIRIRYAFSRHGRPPEGPAQDRKAK